MAGHHTEPIDPLERLAVVLLCVIGFLAILALGFLVLDRSGFIRA
ncbi:MAG: hypothetical protein ACI8TP_000804 [Acidimicrobiales bacterium]|jgi:hypothetical protein